jgi:hypothetical protein
MVSGGQERSDPGTISAEGSIDVVEQVVGVLDAE